MANTITVNVQAEASRGAAAIGGLFKQLVGQALLPATAAAAAFGTTIAGAAVPVALLGAAMAPQIGQVKKLSESYDKVQEAIDEYGASSKQAMDAQKAYNRELKQMSPETAKAAKSFQGLKNDFSKWSESLSGDTMPIFTKGLNAMRTVLPMLTPFVKDAAKQLGVFADKIEKGVKTDRFKELVGQFQEFSHGALKSVISGVTTLARKAGEFVTSDGFKNFLANGKAEGPGVAKMFQDLAESVGKFIVAAGPMAGLSLKVLETLASALNAIPMDVLNVLVPTILGAAAAIKVLTAAQILLNIAMAANPIGLILTALALLATGFYLAWTKSEKFREGVKLAFDVIQMAAAMAAVGVLKALQGLANAWLTVAGVILDGAEKAFGWIPGIGDKVKKANASFDKLKDGVNSKFNEMIGKVQQFDKNVKTGLRERHLKANISDWNAKINSAKAKLKTVPANKRAQLLANIRDLQGKVANAKSALASVHSKTVTLRVQAVYDYAVSSGQLNSRKGSLSNRRASGGPAGGTTLVGENGPEIVNLASGSFVNDASSSRRQMQGSGNSSPMHVTIEIGGQKLAELLIDPLKKTIRNKGGNVQAVLGKG